MGHREKNVFIRVALLSDTERHDMLTVVQRLSRGKQYPPPVTFEGRAPAQLHNNPDLRALLSHTGWSSSNEETPVWLGQPIEIKSSTVATLERYPRSNLLIVGSNEADAYGLLLAVLVSLAAQRAPDTAQFAIADFSRNNAPFARLFKQVADAIPHSVEIAGPRQVGALLTRLLGMLEQRQQEETEAPDIYFIIAGMQRWRELRGSESYMQTETGQQLMRLTDEGPDVGIHLVTWADGTATLERALKRGSIGLFDLRVALHVSEKDSNDLFGSPAAAHLSNNRALFRHEDWELGRVEKFKPYAVPDEDVLTHLLKQLQAKGA
jgi:hypothetical protein